MLSGQGGQTPAKVAPFGSGFAALDGGVRSATLAPPASHQDHDTMPALHALDKLITDTWPDLSSDALLHAFEATPYAARIAAPSTYDALQIGRAHV